MGRITIAAIGCILLVMVLAGCTKPVSLEPVLVTQEVKVPIGQLVKPPEELIRPPVPASAMPEWMLPTDPRAVVATDAAGAEKLKALISNDHGFLDGWEQWIR